MEAKIIGITEKATFNGTEYGFVLDEKNEDGTERTYFPFYQHLVQSDAIGRILVVAESSYGGKTEYIKDSHKARKVKIEKDL